MSEKAELRSTIDHRSSIIEHRPSIIEHRASIIVAKRRYTAGTPSC